MKQYINEIEKAVKRLEKSSTRITRSNAKQALGKAIRVLELAAKDKYPYIRKDGTFIAAKSSKGRVCPLCNTPMKSPGMLALHLVCYHDSGCACGIAKINPSDPEIARLARHLAGLKDIRTHFAEHALRKAAGL